MTADDDDERITNAGTRRGETTTMYSQYGEDDWIEANLPLPALGVFVEVGAGDGVKNSNTLALERHRGWVGLCVEPDPRVAVDLLANRRCAILRCLVGSAPSVGVPLHLEDDQQMTGELRRSAAAVVTVPRLRLDTLMHLTGSGRVDVLSIDTEGTELDVWASLGSFPRPRVVVVEWDSYGLADNSSAVLATFQAEGYRLAHRTPCNFILARP